MGTHCAQVLRQCKEMPKEIVDVGSRLAQKEVTYRRLQLSMQVRLAVVVWGVLGYGVCAMEVPRVLSVHAAGVWISMHMSVCMNVCMRVCIHACLYACLYACICLHDTCMSMDAIVAVEAGYVRCMWLQRVALGCNGSHSAVTDTQGEHVRKGHVPALPRKVGGLGHHRGAAQCHRCPCHICAGTWAHPATSAPGLGLMFALAQARIVRCAVRSSNTASSSPGMWRHFAW